MRLFQCSLNLKKKKKRQCPQGKDILAKPKEFLRLLRHLLHILTRIILQDCQSLIHLCLYSCYSRIHGNSKKMEKESLHRYSMNDIK